MRRKSFLIFSLIALALISTSVQSRHTSSARAATARIEFMPVNVIAFTDTASPQTRRTSRATQAPDVREIDLEGLKKLLQRDEAGGRPLLVNFWATWCEPCRDEFPDLVRIDAQYRGRGLEFITVSLDDVAEIKNLVPQFLREMRAGMPAYLLNSPDPDLVINTVDPNWSGALPATFLFDAQGQIAFKHLGRIKPPELRAAIEKVIK